MKRKVYAPNGQFIFTTNIDKQCPLCHSPFVKIKEHVDEEEIDCLCKNCLLIYGYFPLRQFIKLKGFKVDKE